MRRGNLVTVALSGDYGKPRPAVVIQSELFEGHPSVTVLPLTSELRDAPLFRLRVEPVAGTGLRVASDVMVDKPVTVARGKVGGTFGRLDAETQRAARPALRGILRDRGMTRAGSSARGWPTRGCAARPDPASAARRGRAPIRPPGRPGAALRRRWRPHSIFLAPGDRQAALRASPTLQARCGRPGPVARGRLSGPRPAASVTSRAFSTALSRSPRGSRKLFRQGARVAPTMRAARGCRERGGSWRRRSTRRAPGSTGRGRPRPSAEIVGRLRCARLVGRRAVVRRGPRRRPRPGDGGGDTAPGRDVTRDLAEQAGGGSGTDRREEQQTVPNIAYAPLNPLIF